MLAKSERVKASRHGRQSNHIKQVENTSRSVVVPIGPNDSNNPFAKEVPVQREIIDKISAKAPSDIGY